MSIAAGDEGRALEKLILEHLPDLRGFVGRRMGPSVRAREGVSDVVQSTCREVLTRKARVRIEQPDDFRRWLYTAAMRKILNKNRFHTAKRRDARREVGLVACPPSTRDMDPGDVNHDEETLGLMQRALNRLPEDYRRVVVLSHIQRMSRSEVAEAMGKSESSVRNLLHRALAQLGADLGRAELSTVAR